MKEEPTMPFEWNAEAAALFKDPDAVKMLAVNDRPGCPHVVVDDTIAIDEDGNILYQEFLETSQRNVSKKSGSIH